MILNWTKAHFGPYSSSELLVLFNQDRKLLSLFRTSYFSFGSLLKSFPLAASVPKKDFEKSSESSQILHRLFYPLKNINGLEKHNYDSMFKENGMTEKTFFFRIILTSKTASSILFTLLVNNLSTKMQNALQGENSFCRNNLLWGLGINDFKMFVGVFLTDDKIRNRRGFIPARHVI